MSKKNFVIAIDGPAGAGKSTVCSVLARRLNARKLDTGSMYRAVAYFAAKKKSITHGEIVELARVLHFEFDETGTRLKTNGRYLGNKVRTPKISRLASVVSKLPGVRKVLTTQQRKLARNTWGPVIVEGRDMGTVVFPKARYKFFVTASPRVRAQRRYMETLKLNPDVKFEDILKDQIRRDRQDSQRKCAPLKKAHDAIMINTSKMSVDEVVTRMLKRIGNT